MPRVDRLPPPPAPGEVQRSPAVAVAGEVAATIPGLAGGPRLDARVHVPPTRAPRRAVVICHPHPLYGGSMNSPVPLALAKVLSDKAPDQVAWVRFDFRGVGASEGQHDDARGEVDDVLAVIAHLRGLAAGAPLSLCGHSFGSFVALQAAARDGHVDRLLLLAPSTRFFGFRERAVHRGVAGSSTIFLGDRDEFCDVDEGRALASELGAEFRVFEGFDHHFLKSRRAMAEAALPVIAPEVVSP
jgi:alpha/beta superfamily hydrolase